ncbi:MAG: hypothetical protein L0Y44_15960 [Phycisphaerales bacterium]|nr:hypothetical protein [Phycisphaerales bacterium]MCI0676058.1 hypothetical protein [Phycisphaerales bacterium]
MTQHPTHAPGVLASTNPLGPHQLQAIARARLQGRKISRAATTAAISGWTTAVFALLTLPFGIWSLPALLLGAGFAVVAFVEIRASQALRRFDRSVPVRLALNQAALFLMLAAYCGWSIYQTLTSPNPYEAYIAAGDEVSRMVKPIAQLNTLVSVLFYGGVALGSLIAQGLAALYYFTRRRHIDDYLRRTPTWIIDTLRVAA